MTSSLIKKLKTAIDNRFFSSGEMQKGFSLVELLVAVSLFVIVTAMSSASIISIIDAAGQSRVSGQALNAITFAMEDIVKNARLGSKYYCMDQNFIDDEDPTDLVDQTGNDCTGTPGRGLGFTGSDGATLYVYYLDGGQLVKGTDSADPFDDTVTLLPPGVELRNMLVTVSGSKTPAAVPTADYTQPRAELTFEFIYQYRGNENSVLYQTSITSRSLDTI